MALIGSDCDNDLAPSGLSVPLPVHTVALCAMGLPILDACDLECLGTMCSERGKYDFLFTLSPLVLQGATGSPANPLATF